MLEDTLYLDNIHEYVQDEDQIVTYKWLSRKLDVPVNAAKRMLYAYVSRCRSAGTPVNVTYVVTGVQTDRKVHHVSLVEEDQLEATKEQLDCVWGVHVYSVQKGKLKDSGVLYAADHAMSRLHLDSYSKWSPIDCPNVPALVDPGGGARSSQEAREPQRKATFKFPRLSHMTEEEGGGGGAEPDVDSTKPEAHTVQKKPELSKVPAQSKAKSHPKGTVAAFFSKQATQSGQTAKKGGKTQPDEQVIPVKPADQPRVPKQAHLQTTPTKKLTQRSPGKSPKRSPAKKGSRSQASGKQSGAILFSGLHDSDFEGDEEDVEVLQVQSSKPKRGRKKGTLGDTGTSAIGASGGVSQSQRKRKRVQDMSSDEESDKEVKDAAQTRRDTRREGGSDLVRRRKRVKKLVSKMYEGDDGSMVTEKVWESVSTSASEGEEEGERGPSAGSSHRPMPTPSPQKAKGEQQSPSKGGKATKQSSLRSFFGH